MLILWRRRQPDTFFNFWQHRSNDVVLEIFALAHEGYIRTWREYWSARWRCLLLLWCAGGFIALQIAVTQDAFLIATHTLERLRAPLLDKKSKVIHTRRNCTTNTSKCISICCTLQKTQIWVRRLLETAFPTELKMYSRVQDFPSHPILFCVQSWKKDGLGYQTQFSQNSSFL